MFALNLALAINLIILFIAFYFRKDNSLPNKILGLLLLVNAVSFLGNATITGGYFIHFPYIFFLSWCTSTFFSPLIFSYTCLLVGSNINFKHPIWIAAFLISLFGLSFPISYILHSPDERAQLVASLFQEPFPWQMTVINILTIFLLWAGIIASNIKVYQYKKNLLSTVSNLEKTKLSFITRFVQLITLLILITTILYLILPQYQVEYLYIPCLITLIYLFVLYYSFRYQVIFSSQDYGQYKKENQPIRLKTHACSTHGLFKNQEDRALLAQNIESYLNTSEAYTDPDFNLKQLATNMSCTIEKLSCCINKEMEKNFYDLINEKRIAKAKILLQNQASDLSIEGIGYESGFNSKASFYRAFKKYTSHTPSEYISYKKSL